MGQRLLRIIQQCRQRLSLSWRSVAICVGLAAGFFTFQSLPVLATEFLAANNVKISGEVIRFTDSTVTIRPAVGSMIILAPGDIKSVRYATKEGAMIEGQLKSWHDGVYVIETDVKLISVKDGKITSEIVATAPKDQKEEVAAEQTLANSEKDQSADAEASAVEAAEAEPRPIKQEEVIESAEVSEEQVLEEQASEEQADVDLVQIKATAEVTTEEAEVLVFDISSSRPSEDDIILVYATVEDTAKAGLDFVEKKGVLVLPAGEVSTELVVPLIDDDEVESDEFMMLFLSGAPDVATIPLREVTATIIDNDG